MSKYSQIIVKREGYEIRDSGNKTINDSANELIIEGMKLTSEWYKRVIELENEIFKDTVLYINQKEFAIKIGNGRGARANGKGMNYGRREFYGSLNEWTFRGELREYKRNEYRMRMALIKKGFDLHDPVVAFCYTALHEFGHVMMYKRGLYINHGPAFYEYLERVINKDWFTEFVVQMWDLFALKCPQHYSGKDFKNDTESLIVFFRPVPKVIERIYGYRKNYWYNGFGMKNRYIIKSFAKQNGYDKGCDLRPLFGPYAEGKTIGTIEFVNKINEQYERLNYVNLQS